MTCQVNREMISDPVIYFRRGVQLGVTYNALKAFLDTFPLFVANFALLALKLSAASSDNQGVRP